MTLSLVKVRSRVRSRLRDVDGRMTNPSVIDVDMAIADAYLALEADLPAFTLYTASAFTISAGTDLFSLPVTVTSSGYGTGTVEYAGQVDIQLVSTGKFLQPKTLDELNAFRDGQAVLLTNVPYLFALYQDGSNVVRGRCYPAAKSAEVCNLYSSLKVDDLRDYIGAGSSAMDDVSVNLGRDGAAALVAYTSAMLVKRMDDAALKLRGINPAVADAWFQEARDLMWHEGATRKSLETVGETQQWIP